MESSTDRKHETILVLFRSQFSTTVPKIFEAALEKASGSRKLYCKPVTDEITAYKPVERCSKFVQ